MRKQEFLHLHSLLVQVADYYGENGYDPELESYHSLTTRPTSIHRSKGDHKEAVFTLADGLTASFDDEKVEPVAPSDG